MHGSLRERARLHGINLAPQEVCSRTNLKWRTSTLDDQDCLLVHLLSLIARSVGGPFNLLSLDMSGGDRDHHQPRGWITDAGVCSLAKAAEVGMPALAELYLDSNRITCTGIIRGLATAMQVLSRLKVLSLEDNYIGEQGVSALADGFRLGLLPSLCDLYLTDNEMGGEGLKALVAALADRAPPHLKRLGLAKNAIGDAGALQVCRIPEGALPSLTALYLSCNGISRIGLQKLLETLSCSGATLGNLQELGISGNHAWGDGVWRVDNRRHLQVI